MFQSFVFMKNSHTSKNPFRADDSKREYQVKKCSIKSPLTGLKGVGEQKREIESAARDSWSTNTVLLLTEYVQLFEIHLTTRMKTT